MERDRCGMRTRSGDEFTTLKVRERALDRASGEAGGGRDGLMRHAHGPIRLLGCLAIKVEVDDKRGQAVVMAHQVGHESVEQVGVYSHLYHRSV
jgi:hypothetical protein